MKIGNSYQKKLQFNGEAIFSDSWWNIFHRFHTRISLAATQHGSQNLLSKLDNSYDFLDPVILLILYLFFYLMVLPVLLYLWIKFKRDAAAKEKVLRGEMYFMRRRIPPRRPVPTKSPKLPKHLANMSVRVPSPNRTSMANAQASRDYSGVWESEEKSSSFLDSEEEEKSCSSDDNAETQKLLCKSKKLKKYTEDDDEAEDFPENSEFLPNDETDHIHGSAVSSSALRHSAAVLDAYESLSAPADIVEDTLDNRHDIVEEE